MIDSWWQRSVCRLSTTPQGTQRHTCLEGSSWHLADVTWLLSLFHTSFSWHTFSICPEYSSRLTSVSEFTGNCSFRNHLKQFSRPLPIVLWHPRQWKVLWTQSMGPRGSHSACFNTPVPLSWQLLHPKLHGGRDHTCPLVAGAAEPRQIEWQSCFRGGLMADYPTCFRLPSIRPESERCHNHACFSKM